MQDNSEMNKLIIQLLLQNSQNNSGLTQLASLSPSMDLPPQKDYTSDDWRIRGMQRDIDWRLHNFELQKKGITPKEVPPPAKGNRISDENWWTGINHNG